MPESPLLVFANREEAYARPATAPLILPSDRDAPAWLGGVDLLAGGTWLGVNAHGLLAAVTNRRRTIVPIEPRSRGQLCRSLLAARSVEAATHLALGELRSGQFPGCNLLIATRESATVIEFGEELTATPLPAGLHLITNGVLNDAADARIARVRNELGRAALIHPSDWGLAAQQACARRSDLCGPAIWLDGADRGTVSSTILTLGDRPEESRFWYAARPPNPVLNPRFEKGARAIVGVESRPGMPISDEGPTPFSTAPYADVTPLLHGMMTGGTAPIGSHRIHLRGPWRITPLASAIPRADAARSAAPSEFPAARAMSLPAPWSAIFPAFCGTIAFQRRFHRPNNLDRHERVDLVLEGVSRAGHVSLNGRGLGSIDPATHAFRCDITGFVSGNDELLVELDVAPAGGESPAAPPWQIAALEIHTQAGRSAPFAV